MQPFAKLYEADDVGQVLVTINAHVVKIRFVPPGLGLSALVADLPDTDDGVRSAERLFANLDEESALNSVRALLAEPDFQALLAKPEGSLDA